MPLNVGRFYTSSFLIASALCVGANAQAPAPQVSPSPAAPAASTQTQTTVPPQIAKSPTAAEVMRDRISKAKAFIAIRNYSAAIYELENIRRETSDQSVISVTSVLLMNSYLEQGDHKRAQAMLNQAYAEQKTTKPNALNNYSTVAGQIIKGARTQVERYRSLGLSVNDRNLPLEALADLEKMRETVELVITQSKEIAADKVKTSTGLMLQEEATNSRVIIARDDYDARRWRDAVADSREQMANSRSIVINAVDGTTYAGGTTPVAGATPSQPSNSQVAIATPTPVVEFKPVVNAPAPSSPQPSDTSVASSDPKPVEPKPMDKPAPSSGERSRVVAGAPSPTGDGNKVEATSSNKPSGPMEAGSLLPYVTKQSAAVYPPAARSLRTTGVVRVDVLIDEEGNVSEVQKTTGPSLLQNSAKEAIRRWKFKPFAVNGEPVKATGFINFNFSL
jgi:periplasmic protein TonB